MKKKSITIQIDEALLKHAKHLAVEEDKSLSEWVASLIANAVKKSHGWDAAKTRAIQVLSSPFKLGGKVFSRDDLTRL